jgi:hypothetical protein
VKINIFFETISQQAGKMRSLGISLISMGLTAAVIGNAYYQVSTNNKPRPGTVTPKVPISEEAILHFGGLHHKVEPIDDSHLHSVADFGSDAGQTDAQGGRSKIL